MRGSVVSRVWFAGTIASKGRCAVNTSGSFGSPLNLDELRARLARMTDTELLEFGTAVRHMLSRQAHKGTPLEAYAVQLREARDEWKRRHPIPSVFAD